MIVRFPAEIFRLHYLIWNMSRKRGCNDLYTEELIEHSLGHYNGVFFSKNGRLFS